MTQQTIPDIKWDLLLRYRFIEIISYWEGRLTANHLMDAFKIGRQQASKDINWYKRQYPDNLAYDLQIKGHVPTPSFRPVFTQGSADEYLQILQANMDLSQHYSDAFMNPTNTEIMRPPIRGVAPEVLRPVIQACREQRRLDINYISLSTPEQPDGRLICPHTLVNNGFRWHVRAYCEKNQDYRDFVLSRIQGIPDVEDKARYFQDGDEDWNTPVTLIIAPHSKLTPAQQNVIASDYGMISNQLLIETRAALVEYMLQILRIDKQSRKRSAVEQQIEVVNFDEVKQYCF
jgi:predicted DNA-binding transcriptional regulator YafY